MDFSADTLKLLIGLFSILGSMFGFYIKIQANTRKKEKEWEEKDTAHDLEIKLIKKDIEIVQRELSSEIDSLKDDLKKFEKEQEKFDGRILKTIERQADKIDGILTNAIDSLKKD